MPSVSRYLPFSSSTTTAQAATYLLGISLFSISFLVFLNSTVSFVVTDVIGRKTGVGDAVGTLGFVDELVALVACPAWGLISDRLSVRWVAVIGYAIIGVALVLFVQTRNVYPELLLVRVLFAVGASASATMVTATLPSLTDEDAQDKDDSDNNGPAPGTIVQPMRNPRHSAAYSVESELTITPERYTHTVSHDGSSSDAVGVPNKVGKSSALAGYVGLFTGCGALVSLAVFLPLPARFSSIKGVTQAQAVEYSFYVVAVVAAVVAVFVFFGLRGLRGEEGKGWRMLLGLKDRGDEENHVVFGRDISTRKVIPYVHLLKDSVFLGLTDSRIALGYIGGFVARASTVGISLFIPLYINTYFISNGFCQGSPHDPSPELKKECRAAYVLSSILTGVAQLCGLICAPLFGYFAGRVGRVNYPILLSSACGIAGYIALPQLASPEIKNQEGRGGSPVIFLVVALLGISQIGAIVCSLGSLSRGVLDSGRASAAVTSSSPQSRSVSSSGEPSIAPDEDETARVESAPLLRIMADESVTSRVRLKGSIAGVYSLCGGAAILLLTKLGGYLFDKLSTGAPFYMMAVFNGMLLVASLLIDASQTFDRRGRN